MKQLTNIILTAGLAASAHPLVVESGGIPRPAYGGYVGTWNGSTAVAAGPRLFLSAGHVGGQVGGTVALHGTSYTVTNTWSTPEDLRFIVVDQDVPGYHKAAPASYALPGQFVTLGGHGKVAGVENEGGIKWALPKAEIWGQNLIETSTVYAVVVAYDEPGSSGSVDFEAIFVLNDSGSGLFVEAASGELMLAGIARSVSTDEWGYTNDGDTATTCNLTALAAQYDLEQVSEAYMIDSCFGCDIVEDGSVNGLDFSAVLSAFGSQPGDINWNPNADVDENGSVNGLDFSAVISYWGSSC